MAGKLNTAILQNRECLIWLRACSGEDEELKRMAWVADNLQQELLAADAARMAADALVRERSAVVQGLQVRAGGTHAQVGAQIWAL